MALGAYSIVRYSNNLNDQRINLGVVVWHPHDGFRFRFSRSLDRAQAIDPRIRIAPLKQQLQAIEHEIGGSVQPTADGRGALAGLARWFRDGVEVTSPYPAEIVDVDKTLEDLYESLVTPTPEIIRASSQRQFERSFKRSLSAALRTAFPKATLKDVGTRRVNSIAVNVGLRTTGQHMRPTLWRALSLQAEDRPDGQIAKAKAIALDVSVTRKLPDFKHDYQLVMVQEPKVKAAERFSESLAWLKHEADDVLVVAHTEALPEVLQQRLTSRSR